MPESHRTSTFIMMKKVLFLFAMLTCIFASCSDDGSEDPINPTPKPDDVKYEITIDASVISNGLSFDMKGGEGSISFTTNADWTLTVASTTSGATWCKASATSGTKGSATVKFTVEENTGYEDRSVSVTIKAGTASKTFTIIQKGVDALLVTTNKYEVVQEGGTIEVEVKANIDYSMEISETAKGWISEASSRALKTYKHTFNIASNEEADNREGEITFKSGDKVETVKVYQAGGAIIMLTQDEYIVSDAGEMITVEIKSNIEFGVQMPDVDWIVDEASSRGMSSHTLNYYIEPNEGYDSRSAEIIFFDKNSNLQDTLKVIQAQKDAIVISKKKFDVEVDGDTIEIELNSNIDYEIQIPDTCSWIKEQLGSRGLINSKHYFVVEKNEMTNNRNGVILITSEILTDTIYINQRAVSPLLSDQRRYEFGHMGGWIEIDYTSDFLDYRDKPDWMSVAYCNDPFESRRYLSIYVGENLSLDRREHKLLILHNEQVVDTLTIAQEAKPNIIVRTRAGFLDSVLENPREIYSLKIIGELNGSDLQYLNLLSNGKYYFGNIVENKGVLAHLDLSEASLVDGAWLSLKNCVKLQSISLPLNLKSFGDSSFEGCENLKDVYFNGDLSSWCKIKRNCNVTYPEKLSYKLHVAGYTLMNGEEFLEITIPNDITEIEEGAFSYCNSISAVKTSKNTVVVGENSFFKCSNLVKVDMPEVVTIRRNAFESCTNLTDVNIPKVTDIEQSGFSRCGNLTTISLPSVESLGNSAFFGCVNLEKIYLSDKIIDFAYAGTFGTNDVFMWCDKLKNINLPSIESWFQTEITFGILTNGGVFSIDNVPIETLMIPDGITSINDFIFYNSSNITNIQFHNNVSNIGFKSFYGCLGLTKVELPENLTTIEESAFEGCSNLTYLKIGENLKNIKDGAFNETPVVDVYCYALTPPVITTNKVFKMSHTINNSKLYVPKGCKSLYENSNWVAYFYDIIEMEE